jgi:hypothetical protein
MMPSARSAASPDSLIGQEAKKTHLAGVSNLGIAACNKVPKSVRDQFRTETEASKTTRSSIGQRSIRACYDPSVQQAKDSAVTDLII